MAKSPSAQAERLPLRTKLAFGVGSAAESLALYSVSSFALLYYNQVLGVPAGWVTLALSASLFFDALSDPIVGSLSDRTRSRWGRRHVYMYVAGVRFDTSNSRVTGSRWSNTTRSNAGFVARHPPGL